MNKKLPTIIILIIVTVGVIIALSGGLGGSSEPSPFTNTNTSNQKPALQIGQPAPDFELQDFEGNTVMLSSFRGKPVLIDFWAKWCPFCTGEMPIINEVFNEFGGNLIVLGVHRTATESLQTGQDFANELGIDYLLLQDNTDEVYKIYSQGQQFMPMAAYIDKDGVVISTKAGPKTAEEIREMVSKIAANELEQ